MLATHAWKTFFIDNNETNLWQKWIILSSFRLIRQNLTCTFESPFLYKLDRWFSCLNGVTLVICSFLYSVVFAVSQDSVFKALLWSIMVYLKQIITLMESCLIQTHVPSSCIYKSLKFPLINNCFPVLQKRHLGAESFVKCNMN